MFFHLISFAHAFTKNTIPLTVLYEKQVENTVGETYRIYLDQLVKTINELTKETGYKIDLLNVLAHNEYSKIPIYDKISIYAGSNEIEKRKDAMTEIGDENLILAISSTLEKDLDEYAEIKTEKIAYMINLDSDTNMNSDLLTTLHRSLLHVLSVLFGFEVPNLLDKKNVEDRIEFMKNLKAFELKQKDAEAKEENKGSIKNNMLETDALVNQFDKIMNLLQKKSPDNDNKKQDMKQEERQEEKQEEKQEEVEKKSDSDEESKERQRSGLLAKNPRKKPKGNADANKVEKNTSKPNSDDSRDSSDTSLKESLREVISELRNLRYDLTDARTQRNDNQGKIFDRDRSTGRKSFNAPYRRFDDYTNESTVGLSVSEKNVKEFQPFNFKEKKITPSDLRPIDTAKQ